ncbi:hypothetical protein KKA03_04165 [archaeon]|nr:hypothetical protein [archaeon]
MKKQIAMDISPFNGEVKDRLRLLGPIMCSLRIWRYGYKQRAPLGGL